MNITIERAVLEQALEALNHGITEMNHRGCAIECMSLHHATKAIREELAQPQPVQEQCPECDGTGTVAGSQAHFPCPICTSPQEAQPQTQTPDMFWNSDDADQPHDSIECFLNDQICQHDLEVGAVFTIWRAKKLPSLTIRVTAIDEEECEAEYEVIEQAHGITKGTT